MLVLSRKKNETIVITVPPCSEPQKIFVTLVKIRGDKSRIGILAPREFPVNRGEVQAIIDNANNPAVVERVAP